jgi:UDP-N-acetylglucosamine 4,6-dehydratase
MTPPIRFGIRSQVAGWLQERSQSVKILVMASADAVVLTIMVLVAYMMRVSAIELPPRDKIILYLLGPVFSVVFAAFMGVYRSAVRGYSSSTERRLILSQAFVPFAWSFILLFKGSEGFARSTVLIYFTLSILATVVLRRLAYMLFTDGLGQMTPKVKTIPVIIYGAGREGLMLSDSLRRNGRFKPVAFLDTDYTLVDRTVGGLHVYPVERLTFVVNRWQPAEAIIAKPGQNRSSRRQLVDMFIAQGLKVKTVPGHQEIMDGHVNIAELREIKLEDLLGRDPIPPRSDLMSKALHGKSVLVTGAGGSIGSELVRQAVANGASQIILVDNSEFPLFQIHRQMETLLGSSEMPKLIPVLADVLDKPLMQRIIEQHGVRIVFHAAAYKHVRMVQENIVAGIRNNIWGTIAVVQAAMAAGAERFILVSTDKAVRPASIMGASKRVSELVVQAHANEAADSKRTKTIFSMVRFGNVLGSTGSVVPIFREQISAGGPVLVTHPEVTRYFMLIPEAAQLVIQAGAMAEGGEVFVLDMGEPVRIAQLAETMIELAGYKRKSTKNPNGDIEIKYIGLRDGEKMFEELQIGRDAIYTSHPRIMRSNEIWIPKNKLKPLLGEIDAAIRNNEHDLAARLVLDLAGREK